MGEANLKVDLSVKVKLNAMLSTNATPLEAHGKIVHWLSWDTANWSRAGRRAPKR